MKTSHVDWDIRRGELPQSGVAGGRSKGGFATGKKQSGARFNRLTGKCGGTGGASSRKSDADRMHICQSTSSGLTLLHGNKLVYEAQSVAK